MDPVLASSIEFDEYIHRKREVNNSRNPLSILGSSVTSSYRNTNIAAPRNGLDGLNGRRNTNNNVITNRKNNNSGNHENYSPSTYSTHSFKHSWSMHLNSKPLDNKESVNEDLVGTSHTASNHHNTPSKPRWNSSQYDDHDILSLGGVRNVGSKNSHKITKNYTKSSPYSVTDISESDITHNDYHYYDDNDRSGQEFEKQQYDEYIDRYLRNNQAFDMEMVHSPSSSSVSIPVVPSSPDVLRQGSRLTRKLAASSPERILSEFRRRRQKDVLIRLFDRWRRCTWLDRESTKNKETSLQTKSINNLLSRTLKQWHQISLVVAFHHKNMCKKALTILFSNMRSCRRERVNIHRGIHHHVRCSHEYGMFMLQKGAMVARMRNRKAVLGEIALGFRHNKLLNTCWKAWSHRCRLQKDLRVIDEERELRRQLIHSVMGSMRARSANPPAPPNTPIATETSARAFKVGDKTAAQHHDLGLQKARQRLRLRNQQQHPNSESKRCETKVDARSSGSGSKDDVQRQQPQHRDKPSCCPTAEAKASDKRISCRHSNSHMTDNITKEYNDHSAESKGVEGSSHVDENSDTFDNDCKETGTRYCSLDDIPLDDRLERQRFIRRRAEARVALLRKKQKEEQLRKQREADDALERERLDRLRERQEMKEKADKQRNRLTEEEVMEKKRMLNLSHRFRRFQLMTRWGLGPWQRLMASRDESEDKAQRFREDILKERTWSALRAYFKSEKSSRIRREYAQMHLASIHFKKGLLYRVFHAWLLYRRMLKAKAVAVCGHSSKFMVKRRSWKAWQVAFQKVIRTETHRMRLYGVRGDKCTMKHYFSEWCKFREEMLLEKEIQYQTDLTWKRVQTWLL